MTFAVEVEDVACDIHDLYERDRALGRRDVLDLRCGTSEEWLWVVFRCSDELGGPGASRYAYGLWVDVVPAARDLYLVGPGESLGETLWYSDIAVPQTRPEDLRAARHETYWRQDDVYWRAIPPPA